MMEYKVRFNLSFINPDGTSRDTSSLTYSGHTLEDAVAKAMRRINPTGIRRPHTGEWVDHICNSFLITRGRRRGERIKWLDYLKTPEGKKVYDEIAPERLKRMAEHAERWGWRFLDA